MKSTQHKQVTNQDSRWPNGDYWNRDESPPSSVRWLLSRRSTLSLLLLFLIATASACSSQGPGGNREGDNEQCSAENCKESEGKACFGSGENKVCKPKGYCEKRSDCSDTQTCESNRCVKDNYCDNDGACAADEACNEKKCKKIADLCQNVDCTTTGGTCFDRTLKCKERSTCSSNDECFKGKYCHQRSHTCQEGCRTEADCQTQGGGVCESGQCVDKTNCESTSQCVTGNICKKGAGTNDYCTPKTDLCASCGTMICKCQEGSGTASECSNFTFSSGATVTVSCEERTSGCINKSSCEGPRVCVKDATSGENRCADLTTCDSGGATNVDKTNATELQLGVFVEGNLCPGLGEQWYKYTTVNGQNSGKVAIEVDLQSNDVGNKIIKVELFNSSNTTPIAQETINQGELNDKIILTADFTTAASTFYVKVSTETPIGGDSHYRIGATTLQSQDEIALCTTALKEITLSAPDASTQTRSATVEGNLGQSRFSGATPSCVSSTNQSSLRDDVYHLHIDELSVVSVTSSNGSSASTLAVALSPSCLVNNNRAQEIACSAGEKLQKLLEPGDYYIVATSSDDRKEEVSSYRLQVDVQPPSCSSKENHCDTAGALGYLYTCNTNRNGFDKTMCARGCMEENGVNIAKCKSAPGDVCENPIEVDPTTKTSGSFSQTEFRRYENAYSRIHTTCVSGSDIQDDDVSYGKDIVLHTTLNKGQIFNVYAEYTGFDSTRLSVYFVHECRPIECNGATCSTQPQCLATKQAGYGYPIDGYYRATQDNEEVYAIIDGEGNLDALSYEAEVYDGECTPNSWSCSHDNTVSRYCNSTGEGYREELSCECDPTSGQCQAIDAYRACSTTAGAVIYDKMDQGLKEKIGSLYLTDDTQIHYRYLPLRCGSIYGSTGGNDAVYKIIPKDATPAVYKITVTPLSNTLNLIAWISKGCNDSKGTVNSACVNGSNDGGPGQPDTLYYRSEDATPAYVVIEGDGYNQIGSFKISVEKIEQHEPLTIGECEAGGIPYYDINGFKQLYNCSCTSTEKLCNNLKSSDGNTCMDPKLLYDSSSLTTTGHIDDSLLRSSVFIPDMSIRDKVTKKTGNCYFNPNNYPSGEDKFYLFKLAKGETLAIDMKDEGQSTYAFFKTGDDCYKRDKCEGGYSYNSNHKLSYTAKKAQENVFFVVKKKRTSDNNSYFLDYSFDWKVLRTSQCEPGTYRCDETDTSMIQACQEDGTWLTSSCRAGTSGTCSEGFCSESTTAANNNICSNGDVIVTDVNEANSSSNVSQRFFVDLTQGKKLFKARGLDTDWKEKVFRIHAKQNTLIRASLKELNTVNLLNPYLYLVEEPSPAADCEALQPLAYVQGDSTETRTINYISDKEATYLLILDLSRETTEGNHRVDIDIIQPDATCTDANPTCDPAKGTVSWCTNLHKETFSCPSAKACQSLTVGSETIPTCQEATGLNCIDAIQLNAMGETSGTTKPEHNHRQGSHDRIAIEHYASGSCLFGGNDGTNGTERYYSVQLEKGKTFTADIITESSTRSDFLQVYLSKGCVANEVCLTSDSKYLGNRHISYTAPEAGLYYLVIDSSDRTGAQSLIKWSISDSLKCSQFEHACQDAGTLIQCNSNNQTETLKCNCNDAFCQVRDITKVCEASEEPDLQLGNSQQQAGFSAFVKQNDFVSNNKTATFKVKMPANTKLFVYLTPANIHSAPYVEIVKKGSCDKATVPSDILLTNQYNSLNIRDGGSLLRPTIYTNLDQEKEVFVKVGSHAGGDNAKSAFTIYMELQRGLCEIGQTSCRTETNGAKTEAWLSYCTANLTYSEPTKCGGAEPDQCNSSKCKTPAGNVCADAIEVTGLSTAAPYMSGQQNLQDLTSFSNMADFTNSCLGHRATGPDRIYKVTVPRGKKLTATVTPASSSTVNFSIYITSQCYDPLSEMCVGSDKSGSPTTPETAEYTNSDTADKTLFVYVDSSEPLHGEQVTDADKSKYELKLELSDAP